MSASAPATSSAPENEPPTSPATAWVPGRSSSRSWPSWPSGLDSTATTEFDPYPFILLNLFLSMIAGLPGAILLISAKRADSISSEVALHTLAKPPACRN